MPHRDPARDDPLEAAQVRHPWRATARTTLAALAAAAALIAAEFERIDWDNLDGLALAALVAALITRLLAEPTIDRALRKWLPSLAAQPDPTGDNPHAITVADLTDRIERNRRGRTDPDRGPAE